MKKYIYIIIISLFTFSCENEIPFNIDENPPKLTVNALFDDKKDRNEIILSLTGREKATYINEATIDIYVNGILKDHITDPKSTDPNSSDYYRYETAVNFSPYDVIGLDVKTNDGKHHALSEISVPHSIQIEKIDTATYTNNKGYPDYFWYYPNNKFMRIKTTFTDNKKKKNYYRIAIDANFEIEITDPASQEKKILYEISPCYLNIREDVVLTDGRPSTEDEDNNGLLVPIENFYGVFDNSRINGTYTMTTSIIVPYSFISYSSYYNAENVTLIRGYLKVRLLSISEMQYFYLKALNIYDSVDYDDYLNLPVKFPSNIKGGTGIFGVSTGDEVIIPLKDYIPSTETQYPN